jgi:hypothetical protein
VSLIIILVVAAIAAVAIFMSLAKANKNANSFEYQFEHAEAAYEEGDYDSALEYITKALSLESDNEDALFLEAEIYAKTGDTEKAESILEGIIENNQDNTAAYDLLISLYEQDGDTDSIEKLLASCKNQDVLDKYAEYLVKTPVISPDGGSYEEEFPEVTITTDGTGSIYYTTDGSDPTEDSELYTDPFTLGEGETTVKAIVITDSGIESDIASANFNVTLETPSAPKISPDSGTYTHVVDDDDTDSTSSSSSSSVSSSSDEEDVSEITVEVPAGYTCYYSFDEKPTENSTKYTGPVAMKEGEHVFYAVLQSKSGKMGKIASATYVYSEVTPTPTPTSTPTPTVTSAAAKSADSVVTATATPTPTATATPTPTATATPTPTATSSDTSEDEDSSSSTSSSSSSE